MFKVNTERSKKLYRIQTVELMDSFESEYKQKISELMKRNMLSSGPGMISLVELFENQLKQLVRIKIDTSLQSIEKGTKSLSVIKKSIEAELNRLLSSQADSKRNKLQYHLKQSLDSPLVERAIMGKFDTKISRIRSIGYDMIAVGLPEPDIAEVAMSSDNAGLHPWKIIAALLFELKGDAIVEIVSLTGLRVDWSLSEKQEYSNNTRKRVYRPRVDAAIDNLEEQERLRVALVVCSELLRRYPEKEAELHERLNGIGWKIEGGGLRPSTESVSELFFPSGSEHDAYIQIRDVLNQATKSITIIDPYVDESLFTILSTCSKGLHIKLLTHKYPKDFSLESKKFTEQNKLKFIEVRRTQKFHDRFLILDNSKCYHIGASLKDAGSKAFMMSQIQDPANLKSLIAHANETWDEAQEIDA